MSKLESLQYNAVLAITGAIRGTSVENLFNELVLESLTDRRWQRKLCFFYEIVNKSDPSYLVNILPTNTSGHRTRNQTLIRNFSCRTDFFSHSFFPDSIRLWNSLDPTICSLPTLLGFKHALLKFTRPSPTTNFGLHDPV